MEFVYSVEQYYELIEVRKKELGRLKTNCTLNGEMINRYISMKRFFYEECESGLFFFSDEENYFQLYYYLQDGILFDIKRKNKPILIQNIYQEGKENKFLSFLNIQLQKNGFELKDTLRHAVLRETDKLFEKIEKSVNKIACIQKKEKLEFKDVGEEQLEELKIFMNGIEEIPFYQYPYFTDEEYLEEAKEGKLSCIVNENGKMIAARHLIVSGKKAYGWVGIDNKYKGLYGLAPLILHHQLIYLRKNNIAMCSWVKTTNVPSIQYHNRIGSVWTGQLEDEWLLELE